MISSFVLDEMFRNDYEENKKYCIELYSHTKNMPIDDVISIIPHVTSIIASKVIGEEEFGIRYSSKAIKRMAGYNRKNITSLSEVPVNFSGNPRGFRHSNYAQNSLIRLIRVYDLPINTPHVDYDELLHSYNTNRKYMTEFGRGDIDELFILSLFNELLDIIVNDTDGESISFEIKYKIVEAIKENGRNANEHINFDIIDDKIHVVENVDSDYKTSLFKYKY